MKAADVIADLLARGHSVRFRATGHSMYPIIRHDDYLLVEPRRAFRSGDVVLTLAPRGLTAHRVVAIEDGVVVTRGDNAALSDEPVAETRVLGVVTHAERQGEMLRVRRVSRLALPVMRIALRLAVRMRG